MAGIRNLQKIQIVKETTKGSQLACTTIWRGTGQLEDKREVVFVEETVGFGGGTTRSYTPFTQAAITFDETPATYEQLPYILNCALTGQTGVRDTGAGTGTGYVYTYTFATTTPSTLYSLSIEAGDNQQEEEGAYFFCEAFKLSGKSKGAVTMTADWIGRAVTPDTFTGTATLPTVEEILFNTGALYIDTIGGTWGGTTKASTLLGFDVSVKGCARPKFTGDGQLYFTFEQPDFPDIQLDLTLEHDANAVTMMSDFLAENAKLVRLRFNGSALTTAGTTYTTKTLIIDLAGKWQKVAKIAEIDGNDVRTGTFICKYDETAATRGKIIVVNQSATLP